VKHRLLAKTSSYGRLFPTSGNVAIACLPTMATLSGVSAPILDPPSCVVPENSSTISKISSTSVASRRAALRLQHRLACRLAKHNKSAEVKAFRLAVLSHATAKAYPFMVFSWNQEALAVLSGGAVGFSLGLIGGGGSILAVPLLLYVVGITDPHVAIGTRGGAWRPEPQGGVTRRPIP
jgi:hypothetical protein